MSALRALLITTGVWCAAAACGRTDGAEEFERPCENDGDCGSLRCVARLCTLTCRADEDCGIASGARAHCIDACDYPDVSTTSPVLAVCSSETSDGSCGPGAAGALVSHRVTFEQSASACPVIEPTTSLPELIILTDEADYDGGAEIVGIRDEQWAFTDSVASLELTERTGASVPVRYRHGWLDTILEVGRSYRATLRNGGVENLTYTFLELRDTTDRLLLAYHTGSDQLYQAGAFDTPELAGFTLALTPICRSSVEDGCFEDQTQSLYQGTFAADDRLSLDYLRQDGLLTVLGLSYGVTFWCDSVDGGRSLCGGAGYPGRYLDFQVTAR